MCLFLTSFPLADSYREQLIKDSEFLRNDKRMGTELVDTLVLQLNRIYPQILNDKEAQKVRTGGSVLCYLWLDGSWGLFTSNTVFCEGDL